MLEIELIICIEMGLALNNLQRLICHKTHTTNWPNYWKLFPNVFFFFCTIIVLINFTQEVKLCHGFPFFPAEEIVLFWIKTFLILKNFWRKILIPNTFMQLTTDLIILRIIIYLMAKKKRKFVTYVNLHQVDFTWSFRKLLLNILDARLCFKQ